MTGRRTTEGNIRAVKDPANVLARPAGMIWPKPSRRNYLKKRALLIQFPEITSPKTISVPTMIAGLRAVNLSNTTFPSAPAPADENVVFQTNRKSRMSPRQVSKVVRKFVLFHEGCWR